MIDEQAIFKQFHLFRTAIDASRQESTWRQEANKLHTFLKPEYQKAPKGMIELFWRLHENWLAIPEEKRWHSGNQRDADHIHRAIVNASAYEDPIAIDFANQLMIHWNELYKEDTAMFLAKAENTSSVPFLIEALKADDYAVVRKVGYALGAIKDKRAEKPIIEIVDRYDIDWVYSDDENKTLLFDGREDFECAVIRENLFSALCLLNTPKARKKVLATAMGDRELRIQMRCLRFLIREAADLAPTYLSQLVDSPIEEVAQFAKENLEKLN
ncbi:MAG: HEAT repeat domain-containing protein [Anaerolineae bacterium]